MKKIVKDVACFIFLLLALPFFVIYRIEAILIGREKAFQGAAQFFSLFPGLSGVYFRRAFYILALKKCSRDSYIGFGTIFSHPTADIGRSVYIGTNCTLGDVSISDHATIGSNVDIMSGRRQHFITDIDIPVQGQGGEYVKIHVGEDSWIGNSAVIMADVGKKSVIGAGSVVIDDVEDLAVAVGNPAKVIRKRG